MDTLVLLNSGINFLLLCGMSAQFRKTFRTLFVDPCVNSVLCCCRREHSPLPNGQANFNSRAETIALTALNAQDQQVNIT